MSRDVDEDLIEATIRRVAEAKAASEAANEPTPEAAPDLPSHIDEDAIAATIRRVAAAKTAMEPEPERPVDEDRELPEDVDEDVIALTIRRVAEAKSAFRSEPAQPAAEEAELPDGVDEDVIAATIRRVAEAQAAKEAEERSEIAPIGQPHEPPMTSDDIEEDPIEATIRRVREASAARQAEPVAEHATSDDEEAVFAAAVDEDRIAAKLLSIEDERASEQPAQIDEPTHEVAAVIDQTAERRAPLVHALADTSALAHDDRDIVATVRRLEEQLAVTNRQLRVLEQRLDALGTATATAQAKAAPAPAANVPGDDDWDDEPVIALPRMSGLPPRPAVLRDPSPMTATAAQLEPVESDDVPPTRPIEAAPTLHTAATEAGGRGFDLLPRTYRITVEDKRRAVDLVPLHRALLGMNGVKDMALLSYANGVAIVSIETTLAIEPDQLGAAVSRAMAREAHVEVHNEQTMVVKLAED